MKQFEYYSFYGYEDNGMLSRKDAQQIVDQIGESIKKNINYYFDKKGK